MKPPFAIALLALIPMASPAQAGKMRNIDFGEFTCGQFIAEIARASEDDAGAVMLWIDGYLSGVSGDTELNWRGIEAYGERLVEHCARHPERNLLESARKVGIER